VVFLLVRNPRKYGLEGDNIAGISLDVPIEATIPAMPAGSMITRSVALAFRKQRCDNTP
jgi:hypothetical protein